MHLRDVSNSGSPPCHCPNDQADEAESLMNLRACSQSENVVRFFVSGSAIDSLHDVEKLAVRPGKSYTDYDGNGRPRIGFSDFSYLEPSSTNVFPSIPS
jgi:hypothetical protein